MKLKNFIKQKYIHLTLAILALMNIVPLVDNALPWQLGVSAIFFMVVLLAVRTLILRRSLYFIVAGIALIAFLCDVAGILIKESPHYLKIMNLIGAFAYLFFICLAIIVIIKDVVRIRKITLDEVSGAIAGYLLLALFWAIVYSILCFFKTDAFVGTEMPLRLIDFFYFSVITLTTLGYGDIVPHCQIAKMLTSQEAISGIMYMAILLGSIVGQYVSQAIMGEGKKTKDEGCKT